MLGICCCMEAAAQEVELPVLPGDPEVKVSSLPCGIRMYFVPNHSSKGLFSLALVQKADSTVSADRAERLAGESFSAGGFHALAVEKFLSRNGILPGRDAMFYRRDGYTAGRAGTVFLLDSISTARSSRILDSTLLCLLKVAGYGAEAGRPGSSQALVVAGDLDYQELCSKAGMLSLVCPEIEGTTAPAEYVWKESDCAGGHVRVEDGPVSKVIVEWRHPRIPQKYMGTVLPAITEKMADEFCLVLKGRLYPLFGSKGLHVWISYAYTGSADTEGDEITSFSISCARRYAPEVRQVLEQELSRMYRDGVSAEEYCYCRDELKYSGQKSAQNPLPDNASLVRRCVSNFLYGASLSTQTQVMGFVYRQMPDSVETRHFNNYVRRLLSLCRKVEVPSEALPATISRDSIRLLLSRYVPNAAVGKLPKDKPEYVSGGKTWTYANGLNVVHRKLREAGSALSFCYSVKGGAHGADMDYLNCIDGVSSRSLSNYMRSCGIDMKIEISPSYVIFRGCVPADNLETLVGILSAISCQKENRTVFSPSTYKLFTLAGPVTYESVKSLLWKYAPALGGGVPDTAVPDADNGSPVTVSADEDLPEAAVSAAFQLDLSSPNYALAKVARYVLRDALGRRLAGKNRSFDLSVGFRGYPLETCNIKVRTYPVDCCDDSGDECLGMLRSTLEELSRTPLTSFQLLMYGKMAKNAMASYKDTPGYYVDAVVGRYVDRKDLYSQFDKDVDKVNAAALNSFFAAALQGLGR